MRIRFWGVRGSIPVPGPTTHRIGGNTACVEVRTDEGQLIVIDAGTGLRALGRDLMQGPFGVGKGEGFILFSHTHWDHIQGFPFFEPAFGAALGTNRQDRNSFHLFGVDEVDDRLESTLKGQMQHPYFPVRLEDMGARIEFHGLSEEVFDVGSIRIESRRLNHPNGCYGYRISHRTSGKAVSYASDTEPLARGEIDQNVLHLAERADVFIYDAQYTPSEYEKHLGWGHSTWAEGVRLAKRAKAKCLVLTHHDPTHDDDAVLEIEQEARRHFQGTVAAHEGLILTV